MRETKEQKMARLERVVEEQRKELIELRKERKSLNYKVSSLEKENEKLVGDKDELRKEIRDLKQNDQLIDSLKKEINDIQTKLDRADFLNENLQVKLRSLEVEYDGAVEKYEKIVERLNYKVSSLENAGVGDIRRTIQNIAAVKSDSMINNLVLSQFQNGELYYDGTIFNIANYEGGANIDENVMLEKCGTERRCFFDPESLIIRINPKTGMELDESAISYIKAILDDEPEYCMALIELGDYSCFHDGEELDAFVYSKGMALLGLYEDKVF